MVSASPSKVQTVIKIMVSASPSKVLTVIKIIGKATYICLIIETSILDYYYIISFWQTNQILW